MAIGDYDLVVIGHGARARLIALKAARLKARVGFVTSDLVNLWDRSRIEQMIGSVNSAPASLLPILNSLRPVEDLREDLEFLQSCGVDVILGSGQFSDRQTFDIDLSAGDSENTSTNPARLTAQTRKLKSRRFVIVRDIVPPVRKIMGLNEVDYLTYDSLFSLLETSVESLINSIGTLIMVGGNALNCAIAQLLNNLGVKVQILAENRILPEFDLDSARILQTHLELQGIKILTGCIVTAVSEQKIWINTRSGTETMAVDGRILVPAFSSNPDLNFSKAAIAVKDSEICVNSKLQTSNPHIYLCSQTQDIDVVLKNSLFLPIASSKLLALAHICQTSPVVASIGLSEIDARLRCGQDLYVVQSYSDNLQFHKVLYRGNGEIVGAHFVGNHATELIASMTIIMNHKLKLSDINGDGVVFELCQEIASNILIKRQRSLWFKLFNW